MIRQGFFSLFQEISYRYRTACYWNIHLIRKQMTCVIRYRWTGVDEGLSCLLALKLDQKEAIRLIADHTWKEIMIPDARWFNFYNLWKGYEGAADNSFTYFHTTFPEVVSSNIRKPQSIAMGFFKYLLGNEDLLAGDFVRYSQSFSSLSPATG